MQNSIENGDIEKVEKFLLVAADPDRNVNYILQLCFSRFDKVNSQVRPVFDAICKNKQGISFNDNIVPVPKYKRICVV